MNAKECSNYHTVALISHVSKSMLKIIQARLQQYMNQEFPDVQAGFRIGRGTRDQIANIHWIIKKVREFQINIFFTDYVKDLTVWITAYCGKFLKRWEYPRNLHAGQGEVSAGHGTMDWFKTGKGVHQGYILSPCLFNLYVEYIM